MLTEMNHTRDWHTLVVYLVRALSVCCWPDYSHFYSAFSVSDDKCETVGRLSSEANKVEYLKLGIVAL